MGAFRHLPSSLLSLCDRRSADPASLSPPSLIFNFSAHARGSLATNCKRRPLPNHRHHITKDVLIEILIRLPVKSRLRFKCVCKNRYDLIQNLNFAQTHLRFQKLHNKGCLLLQHFNDDAKQYGYALFPDPTLSSVEYHDIDHLNQVGGSRVTIEGPVNGLFCLFNDRDRVILWNPSMREFRFLPFPQPNLLSYFIVYDAYIGFGSDPLIDEDFKLVLIQKFENSWLRGVHYDDYEDLERVDAMLYTLSTNSWRHLDGFESLPHGDFLSGSSSHTYLNGVYYWLAEYRFDMDYSCAVIAFDMSKEVFREISGPPIPQSETQFAWSLCELARYDDHIALNSLKEFGRGGMDKWMDIWVMQDEEGTWIKKFKLGSLPGLVCHLGFWNTGKLLMVADASFPEFLTNHSQLVVYDPYNQEIRELGPKGTGKHFSVGVYYESLVSVKGGKNQRKGKLSEISVKNFLLPDVRSQFVSQLVLMMEPPMWVANPP